MDTENPGLGIVIGSVLAILLWVGIVLVIRWVLL